MIQATALTTPGVRWEQVTKPWNTTADTITAVNATLAVTARDYSSVWPTESAATGLPDANLVAWDVPNDATGAEIRFQFALDANTATIEMWCATADYYRDGTTEEQFMLAGTFGLTAGTQTGPNSNVFVDTMTYTANVINNATVLDGSGNNRVSVWRGDLRGYKKIVFLATALDTATVYVDVRWY